MRRDMKVTMGVATLLLAACAYQPRGLDAEVFGTSVSGGHVANVIRDVKGWHNVQNPNCPFIRAVAAAVIEKNSDGVTERWTVEGCNARLFDYETYIMSMGGGITVLVSNADGSPMSVAP